MRDEERRTQQHTGSGRTPRPGTADHRDGGRGRAGHQHPAAGTLLALQRSAGNAAVARALGGGSAPAVQRVAVEPKGLEKVETSTLDAQGRVRLAAHLLRHKQTGPLQRLRAAHPEEADALSEQALRLRMPRYRKVDPESDGESESEDPSIVYRTLRPEEKVDEDGFRPLAGHDTTHSADRHIRSGTKDDPKSAWVSFTRSFKVAAAWAAKDQRRIAKVKLPASATAREGEFYDTTNPEHLRQVFGANGGAAQNNAKASQEVVVKHGIGPENLLALFEAEYIDDVAEYERLKAAQGTGTTYAVVTTRAYANDAPRRIAIRKHESTPPAAAPAADSATRKRKQREGSAEDHPARPRAAF